MEAIDIKKLPGTVRKVREAPADAPYYRVTKLSVLYGRRRYPGDIVQFAGRPGSNLEPVEAPASMSGESEALLEQRRQSVARLGSLIEQLGAAYAADRALALALVEPAKSGTATRLETVRMLNERVEMAFLGALNQRLGKPFQHVRHPLLPDLTLAQFSDHASRAMDGLASRLCRVEV